ncbi:hypothetical protein M1432_02310 [Patescibacteria group bacterium]|nr:hypothetical protein [Patescibacteria group bacterium]
MPDVIVRTRSALFTPWGNRVAQKDHPLRKFTQHLTEVVAEQMSTPGHELKPEQVEVEVREFGKFDVHHVDIDIIVFANHNAARNEDLEKRRKTIEQRMASWIYSEQANKRLRLMQGKKLSVWMPLVLGGAYAEIEL